VLAVVELAACVAAVECAVAVGAASVAVLVRPQLAKIHH